MTDLLDLLRANDPITAFWTGAALITVWWLLVLGAIAVGPQLLAGARSLFPSDETQRLREQAERHDAILRQVRPVDAAADQALREVIARVHAGSPRDARVVPIRRQVDIEVYR